MSLFRREPINPQHIAIEWERQLDDEGLKNFRKAVDLMRTGDKQQAKYYEKAQKVLAGDDADIDELALELQEEKENQ